MKTTIGEQLYNPEPNTGLTDTISPERLRELRKQRDAETNYIECRAGSWSVRKAGDRTGAEYFASSYDDAVAYCRVNGLQYRAA